MKHSFKIALKLFWILSIVFVAVFGVFSFVDDAVLIEKYWHTNWPDYLKLWGIYCAVYYLGFAFYYWLISLIIILIRHYFKRKAKLG